METKNLVLEIVKVLDKKKAMDIVAIETEEVTIVSDYFVIASGSFTEFISFYSCLDSRLNTAIQKFAFFIKI